jgi:ribosomal protein S18 acetylase RimI-like enzyme
MQIRAARGSDVTGLVGLWVEFMDFHTALEPDYVRSDGAERRWAEYITAKLGDDAFRVLVATEGPELAGYAVAVVRQYPPIWTIDRFGFIQEIAVAGRHRRRGIGRRLLRAAEEWLLAAGVRRITVNVDVVNAASQALFRSAGFEPHAETLIRKY